jgi:hypothetical protein
LLFLLAQFARVYNAVTFTDQCCYRWNEAVEVTEPAKLVPVIVTWGAAVVVNDEFLVGLSLNRGPCNADGSCEIAWYKFIRFPSAMNATHQWIVFPNTIARIPTD